MRAGVVASVVVLLLLPLLEGQGDGIASIIGAAVYSYSLLLGFSLLSILVSIASGSIIPGASIIMAAATLREELPLAFQGGLTGYMILALPLLFLLTILIIMGNYRDSIIEAAAPPGKWRPSALSAAALGAYAIHTLDSMGYEAPLYEPGAIYSLSIMASALIAAFTSSSTREALARGALASMGPVGLLINSLISSFKPLEPKCICEGLRLNLEVAGRIGEASPTRVAGSNRRLLSWSSRGLVCSREAPVLRLEKPWVVWVYGEVDSIDSIFSEASSGGIVSLKAGEAGVPPEPASLLNMIEVAAASNPRIIVVDLRKAEDPLKLSRLILGQLESLKGRVGEGLVILMGDAPGEAPLAPRGPAASSGLIIGRVRDPSQLAVLSRIVGVSLEQLRGLSEVGILLFPSCSWDYLVARPLRLRRGRYMH